MKCPNCKTEIISVDHEHKLQSQIEQLQAKLKEKEKCAYIGPMRGCPTHGESKELKQLQADSARLREAWKLQAVALREEAARIRQTVKQATDAEERCNVRAEIYDKCAAALTSTDKSNWLAEQKAQWRRELAPSEELAQRFHNRIERGEYHITQMTFEELWRAINGCD